MSTVTRADRASGSDIQSQKDRKACLELKGSVFTLTVLRLHSADLTTLEQELRERIAQGPRFFEEAPVVIDLEPLKEQPEEVDFAGLATLMRRLKLVPVGVRHANLNHQLAAVEAGLALMKGGSIRELPLSANAAELGASSTPAGEGAPQAATTEKRAEAAPPEKLQPAPSAEKVSQEKDKSERTGTRTVQQPIRSGQQIYARGGDLIVLSAVNAGAEIVADGNIHVYAPLRGRALAGIHGDAKARIFCQSFEAELVSVAGHYRVFEDKVPAELYRKPVQIYLNDKDQLTIEPMA
jgi:septum site-determining protein MinC